MIVRQTTSDGPTAISRGLDFKTNGLPELYDTKGVFSRKDHVMTTGDVRVFIKRNNAWKRFALRRKIKYNINNIFKHYFAEIFVSKEI